MDNPTADQSDGDEHVAHRAREELAVAREELSDMAARVDLYRSAGILLFASAALYLTEGSEGMDLFTFNLDPTVFQALFLASILVLAASRRGA